MYCLELPGEDGVSLSWPKRMKNEAGRAREEQRANSFFRLGDTSSLRQVVEAALHIIKVLTIEVLKTSI